MIPDSNTEKNINGQWSLEKSYASKGADKYNNYPFFQFGGSLGFQIAFTPLILHYPRDRDDLPCVEVIGYKVSSLI